MKNAFTLAEVLITLGIIGVVAALTMPSLIQNHRKQEVETKLAKVYSVMNQAINMSKVEYGDFSDWTEYITCNQESNCTIKEAIDIFQKYIGKNLQYADLKIEDQIGIAVYFKDGSVLTFDNTLHDMRFFINSKNLNLNNWEEMEGKSNFLFRFSPIPVSTYNGDTRDNYSKGKGFEAYVWGWDGTNDGLIDSTKYNYGCKAGQKMHYCTKLIQMNGWKIPKDYPLKF